MTEGKGKGIKLKVALKRGLGGFVCRYFGHSFAYRNRRMYRKWWQLGKLSPISKHLKGKELRWFKKLKKEVPADFHPARICRRCYHHEMFNLELRHWMKL